MFLRRCAVFASLLAILTVMAVGASAQAPQTVTAQSTAAVQPAVPADKQQRVKPAAIAKKAQIATGVNIDAKIKRWRDAIDRIEQRLMNNSKVDHRILEKLRTELVSLRGDTGALLKKIEPALDTANDNLQALPPAPAQGQEPELAQAALYRAETTAYHAYLNSARGSLEGMQSRITKLIGHFLEIRRSRATSNLFQRAPSVFSLETWRKAPGQIMEATSKARLAVMGWWDGQENEQILPLIGVALAIWLGLRVFMVAAVRRLRRWEDDGEPPFWRRASDAAGIILLRSTPVILPLVFLYIVIDNIEAFPDDIDTLFFAGVRSITVIVVLNALVFTALSPADQRWRLIPISNAAAVRISNLMLTIALIYGASSFMQTVTYLFKTSGSPRLVLILLPNAAIALLAAAILRTPTQEDKTEGTPSSSWLHILRLIIWVMVTAIVASGLAGYVPLSRFFTQQLIVTGTILAMVYLLLLWANGVAQALASDSSDTGRWLAANGKLDQGSRQRLSIPISLLLKSGVLLAAVPLILNQWRFGWADIFEWYRQLFFGFHIGNIQVSLAGFLAFAIVFALGYFAAKFFQQWLDTQVLGPAGLSRGLRDSIRTAVGYIGLSAAALIALSYAGFSLSNLAIVAGAFSVGIGFGLQSVVNNFVSGLILLAERPIKVGDWVVAGGEEGYVRKVSVRSTEIETFDGANVLIPNSFFISEKVKNWTLRNNIGRVTIKASVSSNSNPRDVRAILLKVAHDHPAVTVSPAPLVYLDDFNAGTLDFMLFAFVYDVNACYRVMTELRMDIFDAFQAAGVKIASHQNDVTLRGMDWLKDAVENVLASGTAGSGNAVPASRKSEAA
jgi:potassium efflux system protein